MYIANFKSCLPLFDIACQTIAETKKILTSGSMAFNAFLRDPSFFPDLTPWVWISIDYQSIYIYIQIRLIYISIDHQLYIMYIIIYTHMVGAIDLDKNSHNRRMFPPTNMTGCHELKGWHQKCTLNERALANGHCSSEPWKIHNNPTYPIKYWVANWYPF